MLDVVAGYCTASKHGKPNEDRFRILGGAWVEPDQRASAFGDLGLGVIACVMDGVGGAPRGMEAAQVLADSVVELYKAGSEINEPVLQAHMSGINRRINEWGAIEGTDRPQGATTMTLAWIGNDDVASILHVGDSVAYRFSDSGLSTLTRDHTVGRGIHRYVGQGDGFCLDSSTFQVTNRDVLCLATDGVTKGLTDREIAEILEDWDGEPGRAAHELVDRARRRRVQDDITAVVMCFR